MHDVFHREGDVDRVYIKRSEGGGGLSSVEDGVLVEKNYLYEYVLTEPESVIKELGREAILEPGNYKKSIERVRKATWKTKTLTVYSSV